MGMSKCDFCKDENASWLSASVHADCLNIADGVHVIAKNDPDRSCSCDCQYR